MGNEKPIQGISHEKACWESPYYWQCLD